MTDDNPNIQETWRPIPGYESVYSVSDCGQVRSERNRTNSKRGRILRIRYSPDLVGGVSLAKDGRVESARVYRLVLLAFVGPCPQGYEANHIDGNRLNNRLDNLEYVTRQGNMRHAMVNRLMAHGDRNGSRLRPERLVRGTAHPSAKVTENTVRAIRRDYIPHKWGHGYAELARRYGLCPATVREIVKRQIWRHV